MEEYFKPNLLLKDELNYELRIRAVVTDKSVVDKRRILGRLLEKERQNKTNVLHLVDHFFNYNLEKKEIGETIDSIKQLIADFEGPSTDSVYLRARTRILHLTNRILRIPVLETDEQFTEKQKYKNEAYASVMFLDAELHDKVKDPSPAQLSSVSSQPPSNTNVASTANVSALPSNYTARSTPVHTLGITFDGDPKNVLSFIERVEEMARARHITKIELYESASDLFSGKAIFWLRHVRATLSDWDALVKKLKTDFLGSDIDDDIWSEIRERKQSGHEPVVLYVAVMESLFSRLSRMPPEVTKVKYIRRGLQKEYQKRLALQETDTVVELVKFLKRLEEADILSLSSSSSRDLLSLDDQKRENRSFHKPKYKSYSYTKNNKFLNKPKQDNNTSTINNKIEENTFSSDQQKSDVRFICWKCNAPNHLFKDCKLKIKKKFCFKCGTPDVTVKDCKRCSGNAK